MADRTRPLCARCAVELPLRTGGYCPSCGEMYGREADPPTRCAECRLTPPPWDELYLHGRYAGLLRDLILGFKFRNSYGRARLLADLGALAYGSGRGLPPDLVVPVPLHTRRLLWRGFNQSLEIARGVAGRLSAPLSAVALTRTRNTPPQTRLGVKERQANIRGGHRGQAGPGARQARAPGGRRLHHRLDLAGMRPNLAPRGLRGGGGSGPGAHPEGTGLTPERAGEPRSAGRVAKRGKIYEKNETWT